MMMEGKDGPFLYLEKCRVRTEKKLSQLKGLLSLEGNFSLQYEWRDWWRERNKGVFGGPAGSGFLQITWELY